VDLGPGSTPDAEAEDLIREVETGSAEDKVAFRRGRRCTPRLAHRPPPGGREGEHAARADGTYLVTGGLGGIGLAMAEWLVERGARHLLLVGRTPAPPRGSWPGLDPGTRPGRLASALAALESRGARIETAAVDVSLEGPLERCLEARASRGEPPVRGVIHAAGILQFQALETQDVESLRAGLAAKVRGAWRLHRLLDDEPLDAFVLCSSSSALLGSPLLGGYAAGNAFLDALAHHRRARGKTALSVNWGTWGEVGMAVEAGRSLSGAMLSGVGTIATSRGLAALGALLGTGDAQAAVMAVDWRALARAYPGFAGDPFFAELVGDVRNHEIQGGGVSFATLRAAAPTERPGIVQAYLRREAARALAMDPQRLDPAVPLSSLGFDSLMAVQLKNRIETDLGLVVPLILFLQGPSTDLLAPAVLEAFEKEAPSSPQPSGAAGDRWEEGSL
jgi:myxalamid-type polyketide synthase MxaE and MxaD